MQTILVAEQGALLRNICPALFPAENHRIVFCLHSQEALDFLKKETPDLILLDVHIISEDKRAAIKQFLEHQPKKTPLIVFTNSAEQKAVRKALELGALDLIEKKLHPDEIQHRIEWVLKNHPALREAVSSASHGKIMVLEKEDPSERTLEGFFVGLGMSVIATPRPEEIQKILITEKPALAILDSKLFRNERLQILSQMVEADKNLAAIVIADAQDSALIKEALRVGVLACLPKPVDFHYLETVVWSHLAEKP